MLTKAAIQRLRSLREKKHRETLGRFVVEGEKVVGELLAANFPFEEIYATADWIDGRTRHSSASPAASGRLESEVAPPVAHDVSSGGEVQITSVTAAEMARISHFPTPSSVLAIGRIRRENLPDGALDHGLTLALDGVQDAGNVGTLLRIADWFALDRVLLSPDCADVFNQKVINASMGSFARVRTYRTDLVAALSGLKIPILGCDLRGADVHSLDPLGDAVIVIGSEGHGLSAATKSRVTQCVSVPRYGGAESLNAAVAAAIVCDNLRRAQM